MALYLTDAFEGDQPKFPIPDKLTVTLQNKENKVLYEFVVAFDPSAYNTGRDQCKDIPWLKRVNSVRSDMKKLISCKIAK